jgi:hypothetical protein
LEDLWGITASPKALGPRADKEQCLGDMPWISRATAIKPDVSFLRQTKPKVNRDACYAPLPMILTKEEFRDDHHHHGL